MLQPGIVRKRLAAGIDRVDRQIGCGDIVADQILRLAKLLVGKAARRSRTSWLWREAG
jgi:hypothetical protein